MGIAPLELLDAIYVRLASAIVETGSLPIPACREHKRLLRALAEDRIRVAISSSVDGSDLVVIHRDPPYELVSNESLRRLYPEQ